MCSAPRRIFACGTRLRASGAKCVQSFGSAVRPGWRPLAPRLDASLQVCVGAPSTTSTLGFATSRGWQEEGLDEHLVQCANRLFGTSILKLRSLDDDKMTNAGGALHRVVLHCSGRLRPVDTSRSKGWWRLTNPANCHPGWKMVADVRGRARRPSRCRETTVLRKRITEHLPTTELELE